VPHRHARADGASGRGSRYKPAMSSHPTDFQGDIAAAIRSHVVAAIPDAVVEVSGGGGHWSLDVVSTVFAGKGLLASHRLVMAAIAPLLAGAAPPVHAVDKLTTRTP
jgi:acid stress-induced BolA-like protein IbaG/YrbA